jgi:arginine/lysine/ornithine decarboxylase
VFTNVNSPVHILGQGVFHDDLQTLFYGLDDMHRPTTKIEEAMKLQTRLTNKESLKKLFKSG